MAGRSDRIVIYGVHAVCDCDSMKPNTLRYIALSSKIKVNVSFVWNCLIAMNAAHRIHLLPHTHWQHKRMHHGQKRFVAIHSKVAFVRTKSIESGENVFVFCLCNCNCNTSRYAPVFQIFHSYFVCLTWQRLHERCIRARNWQWIVRYSKRDKLELFRFRWVHSALCVSLLLAACLRYVWLTAAAIQRLQIISCFCRSVYTIHFIVSIRVFGLTLFHRARSQQKHSLLDCIAVAKCQRFIIFFNLQKRKNRNE